MAHSKSMYQSNTSTFKGLRSHCVTDSISILLPSLELLSPTLSGVMKNGTWNCSGTTAGLGSGRAVGESFACLDFSSRVKC